ncbi:MAG: Gfo/Idh/MocA family oxidoreductase [Thermoguttaceae bacterium]|jgi:predicted dehydrogenase|nr:Gfo/Idh/MocA family oxidoreductase [Thermoguttaceae bacterium]
MAKELGVGIIGLGMGRDLFYLNRDPSTRFEVRAVCGRDPAKAARLARDNGIGFSTTDYRELIARPDIHVVAVFSPDHLHGEHCLAALRAGKHVVVTKPMVNRLSEAIEITREAEARGLKFLVGETCRWYTSFLALRRFYDDGDLGQILFAEAHYVHEIKDYFPLTPWRLEAPQDFMYGGVCHPLDSLVWFLGDVDEVHCYANRGGLSAYPQEENFLLNLKFRNGVIARVLGAYGMVQPPWPMMGITLYGTKATATATFEDFQPSQLRIVFDKLGGNQPAVIDYPADLEGAYGQGQAVRRYMAHLEDCIVHDRRPCEDAREGTKTIAALDAAWRSHRTGLPQKVGA